jgi:uncharacterized protein (DUF433 family)
MGIDDRSAMTTAAIASDEDWEDKDMTYDQLLARITIDPNVCFGKPCIRGHRIWVSLILDLLADGMTAEEILSQHPTLEAEDIRACVAYGAEMARERFIEIPLGKAS